MNPIEKMWGAMVRYIKIDPTWDINEFRMQVSIAWEYYTNKDDYLHNLATSMIRRFQKVIVNQGFWTNY